MDLIITKWKTKYVNRITEYNIIKNIKINRKLRQLLQKIIKSSGNKVKVINRGCQCPL
jgi:hypothetical protein